MCVEDIILFRRIDVQTYRSSTVNHLIIVFESVFESRFVEHFLLSVKTQAYWIRFSELISVLSIFLLGQVVIEAIEQRILMPVGGHWAESILSESLSRSLFREMQIELSVKEIHRH